MSKIQKLVIALGAFVGLVLVVKPSSSKAGSATWTPPPLASPYLTTIRKAEGRWGLPRDLLASLLQQESGYQHAVIFGGPGRAGEVGIAQIIPRWHPNAKPEDPFHSIDYAAGYLRRNFDRFGTWDEALAAYNWGPTALAEHGLEKIPASTRDYIQKINSRVYA